MGDPLFDPAYWRDRLKDARAAGHLHWSVYRCHLERWKAVEAKHREILARLIGPADSVLDCGCGYGRLVEMMPAGWRGKYLGVDISPDFVELARKKYGDRPLAFEAADLRGLPLPDSSFEWAVLVSVRPMIVRHMGQAVWDEMEREVRRVARRLLYLEYDHESEGSVE